MSEHLPLDQAPYWVVAAYYLVPLDQPREEIDRHRKFLLTRDARSRIYIGPEGMNIQMSAKAEDAEAYMEWLRQDERFPGIEFKVQGSREQVFPRLTIKWKQQLVAVGRPVDLNQAGPHLSSAEWRKTIEEGGEDLILLDVRNRYEWEVGHFKGAIPAPCETFREFPEWVQQLKQQVDPSKKKVLMCCTGGIRCEFFSALMREEGFEEVYQLDGGMLKYSAEDGDALWEGSLFVFDDRLTVPMGPNAAPCGRCHHCEAGTERYLNCANMDCNRLFLCCPACLESQMGCCCEECRASPRLRKLQKENPYKPFARAHLDVELARG
ncbi:MAG: rhodanese-related sulfurtransferase [Chlamydiia bacterium]